MVLIERSRWMNFFINMKLYAIAWSLRRLHCPVPKSALVLEVGSGGNPYFRSNVLLDAYENTRERHWVPLVSDRPTVFGFVENLPFPDKSFDFVIASHVLEHSTDPERFLGELQRVAKAGYIEVPDAFMERINPYRDHRLEITVKNSRLVIRKKNDWIIDKQLVELYEENVKDLFIQKVIPKNPFEFHVRYYWQNKIDFKIINPGENAAWEAPAENLTVPGVSSIRYTLNQMVLKLIRKIFSQKRRNAKLSFKGLLACPSCKSTELIFSNDSILCGSCNCSYAVRNGVPEMYLKQD